METTTFRQKAKIGVAGSFFNQLMSNNASLPEVGKGATQLHYTDRTCYEVIEVSKDHKTVKLEILDAKADPTKENGMGHQNWILEPTGQFITVVWRHNAWRIQNKIVRFTKEFEAKATTFALAKSLTEEQQKAVYGDHIHPMNVVPGITEEAYTYEKINILFGKKDYYYDWSF